MHVRIASVSSYDASTDTLTGSPPSLRAADRRHGPARLARHAFPPPSRSLDAGVERTREPRLLRVLADVQEDAIDLRAVVGHRDEVIALAASALLCIDPSCALQPRRPVLLRQPGPLHVRYARGPNHGRGAAR